MEEAKKLCAVCSKSGIKRCANCHNINYCSKTCQQIDWSAHKHLCKTFKDFRDRPSPISHRAILLPADKSCPTFIWVEKVAINDDDKDAGYYEKFDFHKLLDGDELLPKYRPPRVMGMTCHDEVSSCGRPIRTVAIFARETFFYDGSTRNLCISELTDNRVWQAWSGAVVAWGMRCVGGEDVDHLDDLDTSDLGSIINFFLDHSITKPGTPQISAVPRIQGVIVHCDADMSVRGQPRYEAVDVSMGNAIFQGKAQRSQIARKIGLPLLAVMTPQDVRWDQSHCNLNYGPVFLHLRIEPTCMAAQDVEWGRASPYWYGKISNVLFVREDCEPLSINDIRAMCS